MKKGLLSFLLAALTLVGCQNYDDQFDELNAKILALQSELSSIDAITSAINDLNTKIAAVQSSALTAADLAGIISDLDAVQAAVENLGDVGTEVENLNAEVDEILAALDDLLAANAVINQDLRITSDAELRYVASLVNLDPTPTVIVNGFVEVDPTFAATNTAKIDSILAITNKINTILGNTADKGLTTAGTGLTFNELSFLDADMNIAGGVVALPKLVTVGGDITLNYAGNYSFPLISRAATITLTDNAGLTAVDFSGLTTANSIQSAAGILSLAKATSVKLGSIALPVSITLPLATEFTTLKDGAQGGFHAAIGGSVTATALAIDMSKMTSLSGAVTLTTGGTSLTTVNLGSVASHAAGLTMSSNGSINLGSLGFLTDIAPEELTTALKEVIGGKYIEDERFFLQSSINSRVDSSIALNEIVIHSNSIAKLIEYELFIDKRFVYRQRADGIIISTPTGSTAYSLSGGGPIVHPALDAITILPMFPQSLSSSPLVVDSSSTIRIELISKKTKAMLSFDSHDNLSLNEGASIQIIKSESPLTLIHPKDHNFYESCRTKLGWSTNIIKTEE